MVSWKCTVCSYIHDGEETPEICPVCGASKEKFVEDGAEPKVEATNSEPVEVIEEIAIEDDQEEETSVEEVKPIEAEIQEEKAKAEQPVEEQKIVEEEELPGESLVGNNFEHRILGSEEEFHDETFVKKILYSGLQETAMYCFKPGQAQKTHSHPTADQSLYVVKGKAAFQGGTETKSLNEGDLLLVPKGIKHSIKNEGASNLVLLQVTNPIPYESKSE